MPTWDARKAKSGMHEPAAEGCRILARRVDRRNRDDERGDEMPVWAWVLLIILVVLLLTGGIGYGRR